MINELFTITFISSLFGFLGLPVQLTLALVLLLYVFLNPIFIEFLVDDSELMILPYYLLEVVLRWQFLTVIALLINFSPYLLLITGAFISLLTGDLSWIIGFSITDYIF
mgnify:CR=1 FL=1